ncbi:HEAT repeat domain-containing protein [Solibacillus sp. A46]|uniref:HEAT repeat domain-containing protein n=1 Tax=Solibacillus faecavium TaxID=2762221 RepID=A0ABR8XTR3_9BACL|nr:HEAT repeat domain-containing protein [Solibacillus faecavium]
MMTTQFLYGAILIGVSMLLVVFFIFIYLVFKGIKRNRINAKIQEYVEQNEREWYNFLIHNEPFARQTLNKVSMMAIDHIFVSYMTTFSNEDIQRRVSEYACLNMKKYYIKQLKSRDKSVRINVLQRSLMLELDFLVPIIERHLRKPRYYETEEYILMLQVVAKFNRNLFFAHIYKPRVPFDDYEYKILLSYIDENYIDYFKNHFETLPYEIKLALLDFLSYSTNLSKAYLSFYEQLLCSEHLEIRVKVLKAITSFGMISHLKPYESFVNSPDWEERFMMAKILRFVTEEQSYDYLQRLMADSNWRVRKQAALSLLKMPGGKVILQQIVGRKKDLYAVEMAKEVMKLG